MSALAPQHPTRPAPRPPERPADPAARLLASARGALAAGDAMCALSALEHLLAHLVARFDTEQRLMEATAFAQAAAHAMAHETVLEVLREALRRARREGRREGLGRLLHSLEGWFAEHARTGDAAFARHMAQAGHVGRSVRGAG